MSVARPDDPDGPAPPAHAIVRAASGHAGDGCPAKRTMADEQLIEDMLRQLFDCLRNGHLCLARSDVDSARRSVDEARALQRRLATIGDADGSAFGRVVLRVLSDRVDGLAALVRQNRAG
jgi:hypothetical protein